ncbi:MAG TPA: pilin [Candidatus Saccharimonadales bacterium]|nr:pilin [Candidatus Saccharimonadales bacterium]
MITAFPLAAPIAASSVALAADCSASSIDQGLNAGASAGFKGTQCDNTSSGVDNGNGLAAFAKTAINVMSLIVGVLAVIMIVYGGLRYVTSGGSSEGVGNAKNVIIYAIIGLVIVALAQAIVHFVLNATLNNNAQLAS